ncbi:hypothetical protein XELAEV_18017759mg [Xenopus laevis]|uniref:Cadherin domain-containing protein n=1 Tax=Xenopus laevis TaxID=8355 RepID=A0A974DC76_XENLA|nr:hypothetical protein XELAEV_18017759mg [Xenopus laevis]
MDKLILLYFLLGVIGPGGGTVTFKGLPNLVNVLENQPAGTTVFTFNVTSTATVKSGFPYIINTSPITKAFELGVILPTVNGSTALLGPLLAVELYIPEGTAAGTIYQINAFDPEDASNTLTYSLTPASAPFTVSATGTIISTKVFDFETDPKSYSLVVQVTDPKGLSANGTMIVHITNINDETPYFIGTTSTYTIPEEQFPGTVVATVTAADPDADGSINTLLYSINTPTEYFTINQLTGVIQIAMLIDRDANPLRLHPNITLEIQVRDSPSGGHSNTTLLTFIIEDLNDNPPTCVQYAYSIAVPETEPLNTVLKNLALDCNDIDVQAPNNLFNFTGISGLGSNQRFQLSPSGSGNIMLIGDLNFEAPNNLAVGNEYSLTVAIQDIAWPYYTTYIYVYVKTTPVNEYPPVFNSSSYVFNVSELSPPGSKIGQVYATDLDYPYIGITYSIAAGGSTLGATNIFWIDPNSGNLQLVNYADYETTPKYIFTVQATDPGSKMSTASVTVNILEANDEKPKCLPNYYSLAVPVNQAVGTNIQNFKLTCTDRDSGPTSFQYFINSGNINNHFAFSPSAGSNITSLMLTNPFDYSSGGDTTWNYNLIVYITDGNLLSAKATGLIQTGTVSLFISVYVPGLTTLTTTTTPQNVYVTQTLNAYSATAWYVPFVITLGSLLLLGLLGLLIYLLAKYCPCRASPQPDTEMLIPPEKKKVKHDVFWEMTKINTVFDGEAQDPITGRIYEYNSKSGARRWKDTQQPIESGQTLPQVAVLPVGTTQPPESTVKAVTPRGTPNKREKTPTNPIKSEENAKPATPKETTPKTQPEKPITPNKLQTPREPSPYAEPVRPNRSPLSPRRSPKVYPNVPNTPF